MLNGGRCGIMILVWQGVRSKGCPTVTAGSGACRIKTVSLGSRVVAGKDLSEPSIYSHTTAI